MQIEKYTDGLIALLQSAQNLALSNSHQQFTPLHVLKALLDDEDRSAANLIEAAGGQQLLSDRKCAQCQCQNVARQIQNTTRSLARALQRVIRRQ